MSIRFSACFTMSWSCTVFFYLQRNILPPTHLQVFVKKKKIEQTPHDKKLLTNDEFTSGRRYDDDDDCGNQCDRDRAEHMPGAVVHDDSAGPHRRQHRRKLTGNGRVSLDATATRFVAPPPKAFAAKRRTPPPPSYRPPPSASANNIINPLTITPPRPR